MEIIRFILLDTFYIKGDTSEEEIMQILINTPYDMQMHVIIPYEHKNAEFQQKTALIQRVPGDSNHFYICYLIPFGEIAWEKKDINHIASLIHENKKNAEVQEIEMFRLRTRAIEGKSLSQCGGSPPDRANNL